MATQWVHVIGGDVCTAEGEILNGKIFKETDGLHGICDKHDRRVILVDSPNEPPAVEILHSRDPDYSCAIRVFIHGVEVRDFTLVDLDPGRGIERSDWEENKAADTTAGTEAFRTAVAAAYEAMDNNEYIEED